MQRWVGKLWSQKLIAQLQHSNFYYVENGKVYRHTRNASVATLIGMTPDELWAAGWKPELPSHLILPHGA